MQSFLHNRTVISGILGSDAKPSALPQFAPKGGQGSSGRSSHTVACEPTDAKTSPDHAPKIEVTMEEGKLIAIHVTCSCGIAMEFSAH
jgi:hypothetical protein